MEIGLPVGDVDGTLEFRENGGNNARLGSARGEQGGQGEGRAGRTTRRTGKFAE
jgi:hypothetical protein